VTYYTKLIQYAVTTVKGTGRESNYMMVTVVICTYNRCEMLTKALESVAASILPTSFEWEVLVVDNNSTDQTRVVVEGFCQQQPGRFRYMREPRQGVSYARNAGIRMSRGDVLAFMDDDVTVDPEWLKNLTAPLYGGDWAGVGGRIFPEWKSQAPRWLPVERPYALAPFVSFDFGSEPRPLDQPPFGASMAFRKEVFQKYGGFRTDLGRCAYELRSNEDTEFGHRLLAGGERLRYEPSAVMYHPVPEARVRKRYLLGWWFGKGRADIAECGLPVDTGWLLFGIPLFLIRRLVRWTLQWMISIHPASRFYCATAVCNIAGQIAECRRASFDRSRQGRASIEA
jgi:glucosyl-dolichyl phosphate glucuronosyltransferase